MFPWRLQTHKCPGIISLLTYSTLPVKRSLMRALTRARTDALVHTLMAANKEPVQLVDALQTTLLAGF